jgi:Protein of unknown function (DUF3800)
MSTPESKVWSQAAAPIWALVSGLPQPKRGRRKLVILQAYIDDSADDSVFVLAGFVAPAEMWAKFSDAWQAALNAEPKIWSLKTKDAMRLQGQFHQWSPDARNEKLAALYRVIDRHASFEVFAIIPMEAFKKVFADAEIPKRMKDPYYHAFSGLVGMVAQAQIEQGMPEKIDFIFDEQVMHQTHILSAWAATKRDAPPNVKPMLGATPIFKSDDEVLPIQAADLQAWWVRRREREKIHGLDPLEYPWEPANPAFASAGSVSTEETLIQVRDEILRSLASIGYDHATGKVNAAAQKALNIEGADEGD